MKILKENKDSIKGYIFDIQGHSVHDGPGSRTTVFLAGCPLRCKWCSNPEGLSSFLLMYKYHKCEHKTYRCIEACKNKAITKKEDKENLSYILIDRKKCKTCTSFDCISNCYSDALLLSSKEYTISELIHILKRNRHYWGEDGGVTFSGGEPFYQKDFFLSILKKCRLLSMHVAVETSAKVEKELFLEGISMIDWIFVDIKHINSDMHKKWTGSGNETILSNIENIRKSNYTGRVIIRIPIIPSFNDNIETIKDIALFCKNNNLKEINLIPYHALGASKYKQLGQEYELIDKKSPTKKELIIFQEYIKKINLKCYIGSDTPY